MINHPTTFDVVVIGGGPAGATAATFLQRAGHKCLIVEQSVYPRYHIGESLPGALAGAQRVIAVGTTSLRALEDQAQRFGERTARSGQYDTRLFIKPGFQFGTVDGLITNFHLPRSSLLVLVSALAGHAVVEAAYRDAIERQMRFYSYGDAMFLTRQT